ncbi:hypothetical protein ScPMuIL_001963 [Solemya velum]
MTTPNHSCENSELNKIKVLASRVVDQYDDLKRKYDANQEKYHILVERLKEKDNQLQKLDQLMVPVYEEYEEIVSKFEIERDCRHEAEKYASKVVDDTRKMKRQSMDLLNAVEGIDFTKLDLEKINEIEISTEDASQEYASTLDIKLEELENEVSKLRRKLKESDANLDQERESSQRYINRMNSAQRKLTQAEELIQQYDKAITDLSKVSEEAAKEFEILYAKYELAASCKADVEEKALQIRNENVAIKRQSSVLMAANNVPSDMKLLKALTEVEDLTAELEKQKQDFETKFKSMQEEHSDERRVYSEQLEAENQKLIEERGTLSHKLKEMEGKYNSLDNLYKDLEKKYDDATRPPPPPPPPPLPTVEISKNYLRRIKSKRVKDETVKKIFSTGGVVQDIKFSQALEEMMQNINKGTIFKRTLKSSRSPSLTVDTRPMQELNSILNRFKRTRSESDILATIDQDDNSDLARQVRKVHGKETLKKKLSDLHEDSVGEDDAF